MPRKFLTLEAALDYFHSLSDSELDDEHEPDLCILPPAENANLSDEEHINDETLNEVHPQDVCGQVDVMLSNEDRSSNCSDDQLHDSGDQKLSEPSCSAPKAKKRKQEPYPRWKKNTTFEENLLGKNLEKLTENFPELQAMDPLQLFFKILPLDYMQHLADMTTLYALQKGETVTVTSKDILQFLGLLILSGYHTVPSEDLYWSTSEDTSVQIFSKIMSRSRFRQLKKYFHLVDNNKDVKSGDKLAKIAPIYDELCKNLIQFGVFHDKLSIDESMVPYYGHHSCKMFIRGKPIRFGYKIWMICSSNGYPYKMEIYSGKQNGAKADAPLGSRVVMDMLSVVEQPEQHEVFFDNFFTSYNLMNQLTSLKIRAVGTIRENRTGGCPLRSAKDMKKTERGTYDFRSNGRIFVCRWNDSSVVTVASNYATHEPISKAKRYSRIEKKRVDIPQPALIQRYNEGMGGVDLLDRLLGSYRPQLRSKKWWWNLFSNALNMGVVASWLIHCEIHKGTESELSHLEFRRNITMALLNSQMKVSSRPGPKPHLPILNRKTDNHYLVPFTQGRCAVCQKNVRKQCVACEKRLHSSCFTKYHGL